MSKLIPLRGKHGKGKFAIVDNADFEWLNQYKWSADNFGYPLRHRRDNETMPCQLVRMHHMILAPKEGFVRDHANRNPLDNRRNNLRHATWVQNVTNARPRADGTSRYKGVNWNKAIKKWHSRLTCNNETIHLGFYASEEDAARAYDGAALFYHGEFAVLNFPITNKP